jgi:subtilisin family serine protease
LRLFKPKAGSKYVTVKQLAPIIPLALLMLALAGPASAYEGGKDGGATDEGGAAAVAGSPYDYYMAGFDGPITDAQRESVESAGLEIVGYAGNFSYVVRAEKAFEPKASDFTLQMMNKNAWIRTSSDNAPEDDDNFEDIRVTLFPGEGVDRLLPEINAIAPTHVEGGTIIVEEASSSQLSAIRSIPGVMMAENYYPNYVYNNYAAPLLGVNETWTRLNLNGNSTIVAVGDTGLDTGNLSTLHLDFRGRVVGISAWVAANPTGSDLHGHGTHVSGSVLGNGTMSSGVIRGMAPEARLFMQSLNGNGSDNGIYLTYGYNYLFSEAMGAGASIHSDSWGDASYTVHRSYSYSSYYLDDYSYQNNDFLILFAAGNTGSSGAYTIGSQGHAKNIITVGSVGTTRYGGNSSQVTGFSSRGPTSDGRYKPDLMAPGENILSTRSSIGINCGGGYDSYYGFCSGTSMATPLTSGSATLVRDYLIKNRSISSPPPELRISPHTDPHQISTRALAE